MDEGLVKIILAVIALLSAIVTGVVVPYVKAKYDREKIEDTYVWVKKGVAAAEQLFKIVDPTGEARKRYVIKYLEVKNIKISEEDLEVFIEAAVKELNLIEKQLLPPETALA